MSSAVIALFAAIGASVWVYSKMMRSTGNNTKNSMIVSSVAGLFVFVAVILILMTVTPES